MKLTRSVGYALGILLKVQGARTNGPMTAAQISKGCDFPPRFVYRVLRKLVDSGLMTGVSGPGGGYSLARPPREITLHDIVEAVEGPQSLTRVTAVNRRQRKAIAVVNEAILRGSDQFNKQLDRITLARLARSMQTAKK